MKRSLLLPLFAGLLLLCMMMSGVFAQWVYLMPPDPIMSPVSTDISTFQYGTLYITKVEVVGGSYQTASAQKKSEVNMDANLNLQANTASTVQVEVTFYNSTDVSYYYNKTETVSQSNDNITYAVSGIAQKDEIPAKTYKTLTVTFAYAGTNTSSTAQTAELHFNFVVDKSSIGVIAAQTAVQRFADILNNKVADDSYSTLITAMNNRGSSSATMSYIGNVAGAKDKDSQAIEELFTEEFLTMDLDGDGKSEPITLMIKRENLDGNDSTGDTYSGLFGIPVRGNEMTIYITSEGFSQSTLNVYAATFTKMPGETEWVMVVPLTKGTATANKYTFTDRQNNSFNTGTWRDTNGTDMDTLVKNAMNQ